MNEIKIVIEGMKELTDAVNRLASSVAAGNAPVVANTQVPDTQNPVGTTLSVQAPVCQAQPQAFSQMGQIPQQAAPAMPVPQQTMGVPISGMAPMQGPVPTTAAPQTFTIEQLQVAAAGLTGMGKMPQVMGILQKFGIQAMTELPKERYGEFALALREAGAQI